VSAPLELHVIGENAPPYRLPATGMLVIGASNERAGLVISGQGVDDAHCAIGAVKGGGYAVKDLGSREGTIVNGKRVASARLAAGDTLLLGSKSLRVVDPAQPPAPDPVPAPASAAAAPAAPAQSLPAGLPKRVGGYRVERMLGRGGMGAVLLAVQESLHRPVALKLLPPKLAADKEFVARFQKEARAAAALSHPNVVVVHDVGEADGFHFLSMEYMDKGSLEERLKTEGKLPWREVLNVLHDAARGLMFAEEKKIVHRDIKPANLMLNAAGAIKIADLGLATSLEAEASVSDGKKIFGTPHFISPEQARGETVDHRSDLYSLGATAYRLISGRTPFEGETTRDILRKHQTETPTPLSVHVPSVPPGLDALVQRLLAKDPAARPASAAALLSEVDRLRIAADHGVSVGGKKKPRIGRLVAAAVLVAGGYYAFKAFGTRPKPPDGTGPVVESIYTRDSADDSVLRPSADDDGADAAADVERRLREQNLLAENAYLRIDPALPKDARIGQLQELAARFAGTDTASRALEEVAKLEGELAALVVAESVASAALTAAETSLRELGGLTAPAGGLPRPLEALQRLSAFQPPAGVDPAALAALVARVEGEVVAAAQVAFAAELERAGALAAKGRFDEAEAALTELVGRLVLPVYEAGREPAGLADLQMLATSARERLGRLPQERAAFAQQRVAGDRAAVAAALRPGGDVRRALEALDLEGGAAALQQLADGLGTEESRSFALALKDDLEAGRAMLDGLGAAFGEGLWRRRSVLDPRGGKPAPRDAAACDAQGLWVDARGDAELVPWSAFAQSTEAWVQLMKERLGRPYTPREEQGGAGLLRVSAALEAAASARQMLDPAAGAHFSAAEADALAALYAQPEPWVQSAPRFAREREAATILGRALTDLEAGIWSGAEAGVSALLADYADTLLVALLSDGSGLAEDAPAGTAEDEDG